MFKIDCINNTISKIIQERLFSFGCHWHVSKTYIVEARYIFVDNNLMMTYSNAKNYFDNYNTSYKIKSIENILSKDLYLHIDTVNLCQKNKRVIVNFLDSLNYTYTWSSGDKRYSDVTNDVLDGTKYIMINYHLKTMSLLRTIRSFNSYKVSQERLFSFK